jgi:NAD-dependent dihydropyrimidine dehydrogenase PreA subunit
MKMKTDTPGRHWLKRLVLLLLAVSLTACGATKCTNEEAHEWEKWEITETPDHVVVQSRACVKCGYTERESKLPK